MRKTLVKSSTYRASVICLILMVLFPLVRHEAFAQASKQRGRRQTARRTVFTLSNAAGAERPKLVLLIAVDQFRYDYIERFGDLFASNGLRRLVRDGASWTQANYDHYPTYTAPGHSTLLTGAWPAETGIVGNDWYDRESGRTVTSVSDTTAKVLGGDTGGPAASPRRLMASTLGDELRLSTNDRSKVIGISSKDRSAILPAGRHANAAYWFDTQTGRMISSDYYFKQLPDWVAAFNETRPADKYFGARWERLLPEAEYVRRTGADAPPWENIGAAPGDTNRFPHLITGGAKTPGPDFYNALEYSPFSNDLIVAFAEKAIMSESMGQDDDPDILTLSFSANDYVGHRFGPYSQEAMDVTCRVDRQIGALLDFVDARIGLGNTLVVFTADHGVAPIPEHAEAIGLPGGRIQNGDVLRVVHRAISEQYPKKGSAEKGTDYIQQMSGKDVFMNGNIYFDPVAISRDGVKRNELEVIACDAAMTLPGISRCFTRTQLIHSSISLTDPVARRVLHGFNARRSGDVVVIPDAYKYMVDYAITATHGSPYSYDTHVPIIFMGRGVVAGRYEQPAMPTDMAPTLAALLRIQTPSNTVGRVLIEGLRGQRSQ